MPAHIRTQCERIPGPAGSPTSTTASAKARKNSKHTADGQPLRHFRGLLSMLATLCSDTCRVGEGKHAARFQRPTECNPHQLEAFRLLEIKAP